MGGSPGTPRAPKRKKQEDTDDADKRSKLNEKDKSTSRYRQFYDDCGILIREGMMENSKSLPSQMRDILLPRQVIPGYLKEMFPGIPSSLVIVDESRQEHIDLKYIAYLYLKRHLDLNKFDVYGTSEYEWKRFTEDIISKFMNPDAKFAVLGEIIPLPLPPPYQFMSQNLTSAKPDMILGLSASAKSQMPIKDMITDNMLKEFGIVDEFYSFNRVVLDKFDLDSDELSMIKCGLKGSSFSFPLLVVERKSDGGSGYVCRNQLFTGLLSVYESQRVAKSKICYELPCMGIGLCNVGDAFELYCMFSDNGQKTIAKVQSYYLSDEDQVAWFVSALLGIRDYCDNYVSVLDAEFERRMKADRIAAAPLESDKDVDGSYDSAAAGSSAPDGGFNVAHGAGDTGQGGNRQRENRYGRNQYGGNRGGNTSTAHSGGEASDGKPIDVEREAQIKARLRVYALERDFEQKLDEDDDDDSHSEETVDEDDEVDESEERVNEERESVSDDGQNKLAMAFQEMNLYYPEYNTEMQGRQNQGQQCVAPPNLPKLDESTTHTSTAMHTSPPFSPPNVTTSPVYRASSSAPSIPENEFASKNLKTRPLNAQSLFPPEITTPFIQKVLRKRLAALGAAERVAVGV